MRDQRKVAEARAALRHSLHDRGLEIGHSLGCRDERAAIVAWLRATLSTEDDKWIADAIEKGEHHG